MTRELAQSDDIRVHCADGGPLNVTRWNYLNITAIQVNSVEIQ